MIDFDGKVTNIEAITMQGTNLAAIIVRALKFGPKWKPVMQFGRPLRAYRKQPVTLSNPN